MIARRISPTALERRYRRLLRCYPASHREDHREEMLGVLLATARPGQRTPGLGQAVNLATCGLAIRARRAFSWLAGPWQEALAVVSLIAPVLMLIIAALDFAVAVREAVAVHQSIPEAVPFWQPGLVPLLGGPAAVMTGWLVVVLVGLTGRPRPAAAIAGRRRACLMIAALSAGFGFPAVVQLVNPSAPLAGSALSFLSVLAIAVAIAVVVTRVPSTAGWRVAVLVAAGFPLDLAGLPFAGSVAAAVVLLLGNLLFAVLVWPVAIASWSGRARRASRAG